MAKLPIAVAFGDGIGPEIMQATLEILKEAGADFDYSPIEIGEKVYLKGELSGIAQETWETIRHAKAFLKAPITTPQGGGFKSLNVTIRTALGLYANVRPCISYSPFVVTKHPKMNVVIIRENEEDLYTGIEYRQTPDVSCAIKLISEPGSEKIIRYAFEYARQQNRKKVTCFTKDNIMKISDGLFHKTFDRIALEYPDIENEHWIIDIGAAKLADTPELFDVIVLPNLYGDILSDVAAQISGSVGLAGSANIGDHGAMFEAIHGSAPRRAGQNLANPSGLIQAAVLMLIYLGEIDIAMRIQNGWLATIEQGIHTYDIFKEGTSKLKVGTSEFAKAVIKNLGKHPEKLAPVHFHVKQESKIVSLPTEHKHAVHKRVCVGTDVFFYAQHREQFVNTMRAVPVDPLHLTLITNRGARLFPHGQKETFCVDQWRCRFRHKSKNQPLLQEEVVQLLSKLLHAGSDVIGVQNLYTFDDKPGFSSPDE